MERKQKGLGAPSAQSKASHTPGPWHIESVDANDFRAPIEEDHAIVAHNKICPGIVWAFAAEGEANARLIAAAPAMAAALRKIASCYCGSGLRDCGCVVCIARAALSGSNAVDAAEPPNE